MSLQPEERQSIDRRAGDEGYGSRSNIRSQNQYPPVGTNGYERMDKQRQRVGGESGRDDSVMNGSPTVGAENTQTLPYRDRSRTRTNGGAAPKTSNGTLRVCKKCGESLTGQFVRALGGTFHLECFKCRVGVSILFLGSSIALIIIRTVVKSWLRSSFLWTRTMAAANTRSVRRTTFVAWTSCVSNAVVRFAVPISPHLIENTILSISHAPFALLFSERRTATMNMKEKCIVTTITRLNLRNVATGARQQFSSSSWRSSGMGKINTGTQNVT